MPERPATATFVRGRAARPLGAVVRTTGAAAEPETFRLSAGRCIVGSGPACDIVVNDPTVSRKHVELELVPAGVRVRDLDSRNGTLFHGHRVEQMTLSLGGRLEIGAATLLVEADRSGLEDEPFEGDCYRGIVGVSALMRRLFGVLARLEGSLVTVLVEGASGVGKELVARALHEGSSVASGPLVVVNCGAIPRELVSSELFGHRRGAFTGALEPRRGAFESADGGTLFLDEIGELPLDVQPMLLRALELGEIRPVGSDETRTVRVRVIAATNRDLEDDVAEGRFRNDLFYRLAVVRLEVPPLSARLEDVVPLAQAFARAMGLGALPASLEEELRARRWPGNVRELKNAIQAYAALGLVMEPKRASAKAAELMLAELVDADRSYADVKEDITARVTRIYLQKLLERTGGNQTQAAKIAGLDRGYFGRLLVKYGPAKP